jgi:hypothetical protein
MISAAVEMKNDCHGCFATHRFTVFQPMSATFNRLFITFIRLTFSPYRFRQLLFIMSK